MSMDPFFNFTDEQKHAQQIHGYSTVLVMNIQSILDRANKGEVPPITAYEDIWAILLDQKIVKEIDLPVDEIGCHPSNRGQLGLNGFNVHRNGREIDLVGVDLNELKKSACFELCPLEPQKSFQIKFNQSLVDKAKGLIAPLNGREDKLSVGTGHYTAWCRAIKAGCRTPFKELADSMGKLSGDRFRSKDKRMAVCLGPGWSWRVFPWQCEAAWPDLPDLCQRALNSSHSVSSRSTEMEMMVWISEASSGDKDVSEKDFKDLSKAAALSGAKCIVHQSSW